MSVEKESKQGLLSGRPDADATASGQLNDEIEVIGECEPDDTQLGVIYIPESRTPPEKFDDSCLEKDQVAIAECRRFMD